MVEGLGVWAPLRGGRLLLAAALLFAWNPARAQAPIAARVGSDNDAFAFWIPPWDRSDREYSSGVFGSLEYAGRSKWMRWPFPVLFPLRARCDNPCTTSTHSFSIGQSIFTGTFEYELQAGKHVGSSVGRPNAGWLFATLSDRDSTARAVEEYSVSVGVVGPQALAEPMQQLFHALGPEYQHEQNWSRQLPFEPGFVARYTRDGGLASVGAADDWNGSVRSRLGVSIGTIHTGASVGAVGAIHTPEWFRGRSAFIPRVTLRADFTQQAVLRDEFLDGTFFRSSDHVTKKLSYGEYGFTLQLSWSTVNVAYRGARTGKQYNGQFEPMSWGTLVTEWHPGR